jgi:membrane-associated progesterone receptor component
MLTPLDQPIDKLTDLVPSEMYVSLLSECVVLTCCCFRENMKAWYEHFSNKYIVCGKLVEDDTVSA